MKTLHNNQGKRPARVHVASIATLIVIMGFIVALFLSPFSPLHAASPSAWSGDAVAYKVGDVVSYEGSDYKCIQAHVSEAAWNPAATAALWTRQGDATNTSTTANVTSAAQAWSGNFVTYKVGDIVSYQGSSYKCIQAHVSEAAWNPADTAALWTQQSGSTYPAATPTPVPTPAVTPTVSTPTPTPTPSSGGITQVTPTATQAPSVSAPTPTPAATSTSTTSGGLITVSVTFYTDQGLMADGQETHLGACAVWSKQFPLGTMIKLYDPSNLKQAVYSCTAEDTGTHICNNNIDVAMPGQVALAIQLGVKTMQLQVVGFDNVVAQEAVANHPSSQGCELGPNH